MKFKKICFIFTLICICMGATLFFSACQSTDNCVITSAESFRMSDTYLYTAVSNDTAEFCFSDKIQVSNKCFWLLFSDKDEIETQEGINKTVNLNVGDNVFYISVRTNNGKAFKLYTVNIRRKPIYTIIFRNTDDSIFEIQHIEEGNFVEVPKSNPLIDGYTFLKWNWDFSKCVCKDENISCNLKPNNYNIYYYDNLNSNAFTKQNVNFDASIFIKKRDEFKRDGYFIKYWNTQKDGSGTNYECNQKIVFNSLNDIKLYAIWSEPIQYNITYVLSDGENSEKNPTSFTVETEDLILSAANKKGYEFLGWFDNPSFLGKNINTIKEGSTKDIVLYAKWKEIIYSIEYILDDGVNDALNVSSYTINSENILLKEAIKKGYTFNGWFIDENYNEKIDLIKKGSVGNKVLYAKFIVNQYKITFNSDGGNFIESIKCDFDSDISSLPIPEKEDYSFIGWFTIVNNDYVQFKELSMPDMNLELIARWEKTKFNIYVQYTTSDNQVKSYKQGESCWGSKIFLRYKYYDKKSGYKFIGYNINDNFYNYNTYFEMPKKDVVMSDVYEKIIVPDGYIGISTADDLRNISNNSAANYILLNDIYYIDDWEPISNFSGILDGNNFSIALRIQKYSTLLGFFKYNNGIIKNLNISMRYDVKAQPIWGQVNGTMKCTNQYELYAGSIAAYNNGQILNCASDVNLTTKSLNTAEVGGIVGWNSGLIKCCSSKGSISSTINKDYGIGKTFVAGVAAYNASIINNCYSKVYSYLVYENRGTIDHCYNTYTDLIYSSYSHTKISNSFTAKGIICNAFDVTLRLINCYHTSKSPYGEKTEVANFANNEWMRIHMSFNEFNSIESINDENNYVWVFNDGQLPKLFFER